MEYLQLHLRQKLKHFISKNLLNGTQPTEKAQHLSLMKTPLYPLTTDADNKQITIILKKYQDYADKYANRFDEILDKSRVGKIIVNKDSSYFYNENGQKLEEFEKKDDTYSIKNIKNDNENV